MLTCAGYDGSIRWRPGERLEQLFERRCDRLREHGWLHLAVDALDGSLSYPELDERANQLARFLVGRGLRPGDRVGLLSDRAVDGYVGMLAALKARAAYVPLDAGFPQDRVSYIVADAGVRVVLTRAHLAGRVAGAGGAARLDLDEAADLIAGQSPAGSAGPRPGIRSTTCATSSTRRARPGARRGWRSGTPASATSSGWRPRCTGWPTTIASTRA